MQVQCELHSIWTIRASQSRIFRESLQAHFQSVSEMFLKNQINDLRFGWSVAHSRYEEHGPKSIRGPIGNIISILSEYGWNPRTVNFGTRMTAKRLTFSMILVVPRKLSLTVF